MAINPYETILKRISLGSAWCSSAALVERPANEYLVMVVMLKWMKY